MSAWAQETRQRYKTPYSEKRDLIGVIMPTGLIVGEPDGPAGAAG